MMPDHILTPPFPYFGGKRTIALIVWRALGDVGHYIEPFVGGASVLLARPGYDPSRHVELINDLDGMICNVWRAITQAPDEVAKWCDWPVSHIDLMARKRVLNESYAGLVERLVADDSYFDAKLAGYYVWSASCWIGNGLVRPNAIANLSDGGTGVHAKGKRPHLNRAGTGVHAKGLRVEAGSSDLLAPYNPNIYAWMRRLAERLRYVRTICGDWSRVCGGDWQTGPGRPCGVFFDPPYSDVADRDDQIYTEDSADVAHKVRDWCLERGSDAAYRIVLAGYSQEHESLLKHGWTVHRWKTAGGYARIARSGEPTRGLENRHREALFCSPHCLKRNVQDGLFGQAHENPMKTP